MPRLNRNPAFDKAVLDPLFDNKGHLDFGPLAARAAALEELGLKTHKQRDHAAWRLAYELQHYRGLVINAQFHISGASEVKRARIAANALKDAVTALESLGPDAHIQSFLPAMQQLDDSRTAPNFFEQLTEIADDLEDFAKSGKPSRGRQRLTALDEFISNLAYLFYDLTGKEPGYSSKPIKSAKSKAKNTHGPFVRFCEILVVLVTPKAKGSVFDAVRRVVRRRNRMVKKS